MSNWTHPIATWGECVDGDVGSAAAHADLILEQHLSDHGCVLIGPVRRSVCDIRFGSTVGLIAEATALNLRHPNPFPRLRLIGRRR